MKISRPEIVRRGSDVEYRVRFTSTAGDAVLWYRLADRFYEFVADSSDAPLVALLLPAMSRGEDIELAGAISERLFYNLSRTYQRLAQHVIPWLRPIQIRPAELVSSQPRGSAVATGFSCGVDSYCVLADHLFCDVPAAVKVTHLLFNNVGSHGFSENAHQLFEERFARVAPVADRIGLPLVKVDSNLSEFYPRSLNFLLSACNRNVSVAMILQRGVGRFLYASAVGYADVFVGPANSLAYSEPIGLPLLATEQLDVLSTGSEYTRVEKTLRVAEIAETYTSLDVCTNSARAGNCSTCWKCLRTLLTLDIAGLLNRYRAVFDLAAYARLRRAYMREVLESDELLLREIVAFARQRGYAFPLSTRLQARLNVLLRPVTRTTCILAAGLRRRITR